MSLEKVDDEERAAWISIARVSGIGPQKTRRLLEHFGTLSEAWRASPAALLQARLERKVVDALIEERRVFDPYRALQRLGQLGGYAITWHDPEYPDALKATPDCPPVLYVRGMLSVLKSPIVAIVGTRRVTGYGREQSERFGREVAQLGWVVASGLARGVDTFAHRGALSARFADGVSSGVTIAVLGHGIDTVYPPENARLAAQIAERGAIVSDYALGVGPAADHFPARNRIISGLSLGTLVIEAPSGSGALITTRYANEQGRQVFAIPGPVTSPASDGCHRLIQDGARLVVRVEDIIMDLLPSLAVLGSTSNSALAAPDVGTSATWSSAQPEQVALPLAVPEAPPPAYGPDTVAGRVMAALRDAPGPLHIDELVRLIVAPAPEVAGVVMVLELEGWVRDEGAMMVALVRHA